MITTRTKTTIKIKTPTGLHIDAGFGKGKPLADVVCHLISFTGLKSDPESIKKIQNALNAE